MISFALTIIRLGKIGGKEWVRADIADYDSPKFDDLKMSLAALPDLKTESEQAVKLPEFLQIKIPMPKHYQTPKCVII